MPEPFHTTSAALYGLMSPVEFLYSGGVLRYQRQDRAHLQGVLRHRPMHTGLHHRHRLVEIQRHIT